MGTRDKRRATREARAYEDAWLEGRWDPWTSDAFTTTADLQDAIEEYVAHKVDRGHWRERTAKDRTDRLGRFAETLPPGATVAMVTPEHVEAFIERKPMGHDANARNVLDPSRLSPNAARTYHSQLKGFFAWCVAKGYTEASPVADVDRPAPAPREEPVYLSVDQFRRLLQEIRRDRDRKAMAKQLRGPYVRQIVYLVDVFELAAYTGLRPSELRRLRWRDVDRDRGVLHVRHTDLGRVKKDVERVVPILTPAAGVLDRLAEARATENDDHTVLTSPKPLADGTPRPISVQVISRSFRHYARAIGLDGVSLYSLRRTTATWLASHGASLQIAQRVLGHANVRTTAEHYAGVLPEAVVREADAAMRRAVEPL
ncbi:MAG: site-specific integrase [Bacteroidota bacterium]